jgi:hypothetical protein
MPLAVRTARPSLELRIESVPAANVLLGFAELAVKLALDPTATATAAMSAERAPSTRIGWRATKSNVVMVFLSVPQVAVYAVLPFDSLVIVCAGEAVARNGYENGLRPLRNPLSRDGWSRF